MRSVVWLVAVAVSLLGGCVGAGGNSSAGVRPSSTFADYQRETLARLRTERPQTGAEDNLALNAPREWPAARQAPGRKPAKGILLVHGLGDSPWSFNDVAEHLAAQGYLVRTVLLPGHGSHPEHLLDVRLEQWQQVVQEQADVLGRDVEQVYLGGFSTGANLVLEVAYANPQVAGLVLFSPAFRSDTAFDWVTPWISWARPWLFGTQGLPVQSAVRYLNVPTNGFAQFYRSSQAARRLLQQRPYDKPVFMAVAEHDSVLDTAYLLNTFQTHFTHPSSRLVWYGASPPELTDTARVLVREDRLAEQRISQFSHMGLLFSPENPLYGAQGSLRICWNGQDEAALQACEAGEPVWYSDWGYQEPGKVHARLTFNPYFVWQSDIMRSVLSASAPLVAPAPSAPAQVRR